MLLLTLVFALCLKFMTVSFFGVVFQNNQIAGACVTGICCALIMAFFAFQKPYLYVEKEGNMQILSVNY